MEDFGKGGLERGKGMELWLGYKSKKKMNGKEKPIKCKTFTSVNIKMFH